MPETYADLLQRGPRPIPEVTPAEADALRPPAPRDVDVREASEWEQGHIRRDPHQQELRRAADRAAFPIGTRLILYCAGGVRSLFAAQTLSSSATATSRRCRRLPGLRPRACPGRAGRPHQRAEAALQPAPADPRGRRGGPGEAARVEGAAHRRRRPRPPGRAVSRRRGCRDDRHRRLRRGRPVEPPAPDPPHDDRVGSARSSRPEDHQRAQPGRHRRAHEEMLVADNVDRIIGLRRDARRDRHVRDPLPPQRRGGREEHPGRPRQRLPVRGPADDVHPVRGAVLPVPLPTRRRPSSRPAAPWPACWASCPGSWACSRRTRRSSCCSGIGETLAGRLLLFDALDTTFTELKLRRDPTCPVCSTRRSPARGGRHAAADPEFGARRRGEHVLRRAIA